MKILVINSGSSSIKSQYFVDHKSVASLLIENIGEDSSQYSIEYDGQTISERRNIPNHHDALNMLFELMSSLNILSSIDELDAVGHRVVHGGAKFDQPTLITQEVIETIRSLEPLAPLHNPANLDGIEIIQKIYPHLPQVAIFDTAFHQSMPREAYLYPIPYHLYEERDIRRYGFHGTSHLYLSKRVAQILDKDISSLNLITLHLGNGASATAIQNGKSIDTSMGFTPLAGLMMGSRSGDIDPAIIPYLSKDLTIDKIDKILNKKSGLLGISGTSNMREITERVDGGDEKSQLAMDMFVYRIKKYIGAYSIVLGRVDAIVFSGGIGENVSKIRELICRDMDLSIGLKIDLEQNSIASDQDRAIHQSDSKIKLFVIQTDEELEISMQTQDVVMRDRDKSK
jgi:acetate kinase